MQRHLWSRSVALAVLLLGLAANWGYAQVEVEDDQPELVISEEKLVVQEGKRGDFSVMLATPPTERVTVNVQVSQMGGFEKSDVKVNGIEETELIFNSGNWNQFQMVEVVTLNDDDMREDRARIALSASGAVEYSSERGLVKVVVADNTEWWMYLWSWLYPLINWYSLMVVTFFVAMIYRIGRSGAAEDQVVLSPVQQSANSTAHVSASARPAPTPRGNPT